MKLVIDKKTMWFALVVFVILISLIIFLIFRTRSKYVWPEVAAAAAAFPTTPIPIRGAYDGYVSNVTTCNNQYAENLVRTPATAAATKQTCLENATSIYLKGRCPAIDPRYADGTAASESALTSFYPGTYASAKQAFTTRVTNIRVAFLTAMTNPSTYVPWPTGFAPSASTVNVDTSGNPPDTTPTDYAAYLVKKARDAAIAGATRAYIATLCSDYYKTSNVATGITSDSSAAFAAWDYQSATISSGQITGQAILDWVKKAGFLDPVSGTEKPLYKYMAVSAATPDGNTLFKATNAKDINYQKTSPIITGQPVYKTWEVARYNGPGSTIVTGTTAASPAIF